MVENTVPSLYPYQNRLLEVHYSDWRHSITVVDPSTQRPVYTLRGHGWHVPYEIFNANGQLIGTTRTSSMSSKIEVDLTGRYGAPVAFNIKNDKLLGMAGSPRYDSPAFNGQSMTWKNTAMSRNIIYTLVEGRGMALAKFDGDRRRKIGRLELSAPDLDEAGMDEIVVVLLTLLKRKMNAIQKTNVAVVAGAVS